MSVFTFVGARPGTSNGRRPFDTLSSEAPSVVMENSQAILNKELANDNLLSILYFDKIYDSNQIMIDAQKGKVKKVREALSRRQNAYLIECQDSLGSTPLHHACSSGQIAVVKELLSYNTVSNGLVNKVNRSGEAPLHVAAYGGRNFAAELLLDQGNLDINAVNSDGESALFYAARQSNVDLVRLLLRNGADASLRDKYDDLAVDHCKEQACTEAFEVPSSSQACYVSRVPAGSLALVYQYLSGDGQKKWKAVSKVWRSHPFVVRSSNSSPRASTGGSGKQMPSKPYHRATSDADMSKIRSLAESPSLLVGSTGSARVSSAASVEPAKLTSDAPVMPSVFRFSAPTGEKDLLSELGLEQAATSSLLNRPTGQSSSARRKPGSFTGGIVSPTTGFDDVI